MKLTQPEKRGSFRLGARLRNYFLTGLVVVGPVSITIYIAWGFINMIDAWVKPYVPDLYNPDTYLPFPLPGIGLIFAFLGLTTIGALAANLLGRSLISTGEMILGRMPIVRNVYSALKQIFESVVSASSTENAFQKVGMIEFPSKGIWSIVFVTAEAAGEIVHTEPGKKDLVTVFMPTAIVPPTGFVCFVPRADIIFLQMKVEDAAKIVISAGMVAPPDYQAEFQELARRAKDSDAGTELPSVLPAATTVPPVPSSAQTGLPPAAVPAPPSASISPSGHTTTQPAVAAPPVPVATAAVAPVTAPVPSVPAAVPPGQFIPNGQHPTRGAVPLQPGGQPPGPITHPHQAPVLPAAHGTPAPVVPGVPAPGAARNPVPLPPEASPAPQQGQHVKPPKR